MQCHLVSPTASVKGTRTLEACRDHGMVMSFSLEAPFRSSGEGAVGAEAVYVCAAMLYHLVGPMA